MEKKGTDPVKATAPGMDVKLVFAKEPNYSAAVAAKEILQKAYLQRGRTP